MPDAVETVAAGGERIYGFVANIGAPEMGVIDGNIGRIADDEVEFPAGDGIEPVAADKIDVNDLQSRAVEAGQRNGLFACIGGDDVGVGPLACQRQRYCTAAGSEIGNIRFAAVRDQIQRRGDQCFGVRARDKRVTIDGQIQRPEFAHTGNVRHGFAAFTTVDEVAKDCESLSAGLFLRMGEKITARYL